MYLALASPTRLWNLVQLQKTDLWSLGLTIWELVQGYPITFDRWRTAATSWEASHKPQLLGQINSLPPTDRSKRWLRMFVQSFTYDSPADQLAAQNAAVEQFLAQNGAPSIIPLLQRDPAARALPALHRAGGANHPLSRLRLHRPIC
jgi:hypothetical protein